MPDFDAQVHNHRAAIWRYLCVLGCDASLADDLTQEVFLVDPEPLRARRYCAVS